MPARSIFPSWLTNFHFVALKSSRHCALEKANNIAQETPKAIHSLSARSHAHALHIVLHGYCFPFIAYLITHLLRAYSALMYYYYNISHGRGDFGMRACAHAKQQYFLSQLHSHTFWFIHGHGRSMEIWCFLFGCQNNRTTPLTTHACRRERKISPIQKY